MAKNPVSFEEAYTRAEKYCALQERCKSQVKFWLRKLLNNDEEITRAVEKLVSEGFINEERFARAYCRGKFNIKGWGRIKLSVNLKMMGLNSDIISKGFEEIDEDNYVLKLETLLRKKDETLNQEDTTARRLKLSSYAYSKGFEIDYINQIVSTIIKKQ